MLSLKIILFFCETTMCGRKTQITEQLNLNQTSPKKYIKQRPTPMLCYVTNSFQRMDGRMDQTME